MSKAFKGKTCAYCVVEGISASADHVVARAFFPLNQRHNLPKVPACTSCNNTKSELESYLTAVLPFGGRHVLSSEILNEFAPKRLSCNMKVQRELSESWRSEVFISQEGYLQPRHTFNVDADKVAKLYEFIVRGLCWWEWNLLLPLSTSEIQVGFLTRDGEAFAENLLAMNGKQRCGRLIADGLFQYEGVQATDNELITIWKMSLYGVKFSEGAQSLEAPFACYASTGPIGRTLPFGID